MLMKGISTLVVVILLLLITISLIGFVFVFFQRTLTGVTEQTEEAAEKVQENIGKQLRIDNALGQSVVVRHVGTVAINKTADVSVYINNVLQTMSTAAVPPNPPAGSVGWATPLTLLNASSTATITLGTACATGAAVKITTPAGAATETCA